MAASANPVDTSGYVVAKPDNIPDGDFANYLCTYGYLYHQKEMLEDQKRMQSYYDAVFGNQKLFEGKTVLDVGTGSGILAIWAAQAGARKVYAVEATYMARHAKRLAESNGVGDVVEVMQGYVEKIELPEKVDIIISEWMGYWLLRESMLDSVLVARDRFLKPGGSLYPSHARMFLAPMRTAAPAKKHDDFLDSMDGWQEFTQQTADTYGVDLSCLTDDYEREQKGYFLQTAQWAEVNPAQLLGPGVIVKQLDLNKCSLDDIQGVDSKFRLRLRGGGPEGCTVGGFCGWFDTSFKGSDENPAESVIELNTAPEVGTCTHWGQQVFYLHPAVEAKDGDVLEGTVQVVRNKENHRLLDIGMELTHAPKDGEGGPKRQLAWHLD